MHRVRHAGQFALFLAIATSWSSAGADRTPSPAAADPRAAAAPWPTSSLLVSEVMTGGASASDEFAELTNAGSVAVDLTGFELVYVTSAGGTISRKAVWTAPTILVPGGHLLVANAAGIHATIADVTYTGGFAATGGAVALRLSGAAVDAVGWGDATSAFVEGLAAPAPGAGSSIERLPGGPLGNGADSNDNAADFAVRAAPFPQNLAAVPTPTAELGPAPTPTPSSMPTPSTAATATPDAILPVAAARVLPDGSAVTVQGTLTTGLGAIESSRIGFVQDASGGMAIRLDAALAVPLPAGATIEAHGTLGSYFGLRILDVEATTIVELGPSALPSPLAIGSGSAGEAVEGLRLMVEGTVTAAPSVLADGLGVTIDDGTGPLRIVVGPAALEDSGVRTGDVVTATGPLGQRDSSGTGTAGYRLHATLSGEFTVRAAPSPTPSPTSTPSSPPAPTPAPSGSQDPRPTPRPTATASPSPTPSPSSSPGALPIGDARRLPIGVTTRVAGVVTAEAGRLGAPNLVAIQDSSGGIVVRVPDGVAAPHRGTNIVVRGPLADPYGQLEVRPPADEFAIAGSAPIPEPVAADAASIGESLEGRLVTVHGRVEARPSTSSSGDVTLFVVAQGGQIRVVADASSGVTADSVTVGATYDISGVAGQRASRKGALDGYRVWARNAGDLRRDSAPGPSPSGSPNPGASPQPSDSPAPSAAPAGGVVTIADAVRRGDGQVAVEGLVTTRSDLLDTTGRRIVIEDRTAGIEVLIATDSTSPSIGTRIRVEGPIGRAYDAPRLKADRIAVISVGARPLALILPGSPTAAHEWRLVRVSGTVVDVTKLGDRWRAELSVGRDRVAVSGLTGARIPATVLVEGRAATIIGIVRRPYPGAADRRWSIAPRSAADIVVGPARPATGNSDQPDPPAGPGAAGTRLGAASTTRNVDLLDLVDHVGAVVRVGGLVTELVPDGFFLDDGTAVGRVVVTGAAAEYLPLLEPGDALNATGRVAATADGYRIVVDDPAGLVRVGDPTFDPPIGGASAGAATPRPSVRESQEPGTAGRLAGGWLGPTSPGTVGVLGIVLISLASVVVTLLRRQRARRLLAARLAARLAGVTAMHGPDR